jgi:CxxC motif-containing protein
MSERAVVDRLTCVLCPVGCELEVGRDAAGELDVQKNQCDKGVPFAVEEILRPKRNLATSVPVRGTAARMVSVRLSGTVPREMLFPVLAEIAKLRPETPVRRGQVLIADVLGTGADVIATRTVS